LVWGAWAQRALFANFLGGLGFGVPHFPWQTPPPPHGRNSVEFGNGDVPENLLTPDLLKIRRLETFQKAMFFRKIVDHCAEKHFCLVFKGLVN
jgi:hypothetical protein